jgi:hypothetical protein
MSKNVAWLLNFLASSPGRLGLCTALRAARSQGRMRRHRTMRQASVTPDAVEIWFGYCGRRLASGGCDLFFDRLVSLQKLHGANDNEASSVAFLHGNDKSWDNRMAAWLTACKISAST